MKHRNKTIVYLMLLINAVNSLTKCCEKNEILNLQKNKTQYNCEISKNSSIIPLILKENYNNPSYFEECVDKAMNGTVIKYNIKTNSSETFELTRINKCCPKGMVYNIKDKNCIKTKSNTPIIVNKLTNFLLNFSFCEEHEVVIDILTDLTQINIDSDHLKVNNTLTDKDLTVSVKQSCFDQSEDGFVVVRSCQNKKLCEEINCVRKCCGNGEVYFNTKCIPDPSTPFDVENMLSGNNSENNWSENLGVIYNLKCKPKFFPEANSTTLYKNGSILYKSRIYTNEKYCIVRLNGTAPFLKKFHLESGQLVYLICSAETYSKALTYQFVILLISCIFLLLTFVVYLCIPDLRNNIHGKIVMCNVFSMFIAFLSMLPVKVSNKTNFTISVCQFIGYTMNFSLLGSFSWLNIMCFDIWWTFGHMQETKKKKISRQFLWYCFYAFSVPTVLTVLVILADSTDAFPTILRPNIGTFKCFYKDRNSLANFLYFRLPIGLQLVANIVFFVLTISIFFKIKADINKMNDGRRAQTFLAYKTMFITIIKLFLVMGIPWVTEILLTYFRSGNIGFKILDVINGSQGIFMFIIFVLKSRVLKSFKKMINVEVLTRGTSTTTQSANSTTERRSTKKK